MTDFLIKSTITLFALLCIISLERKKYTFSIGFTCCSVLFFDGTSIHNYWSHWNSTTYSQSGNIQILQGSAVILENNYLAIGLWSLYAVVTLVLAIRFFSNIIRFRLKWRRIHQLIIRMPNWFWFPKIAHFLEYDFHQRNGYNNREIEAELHTNSHVTQNTLDILFIELLKTVFLVLFYFFYKKAIQLNHEFLADEKVVTPIIMFYQSLLLSKRNENQLLLGQ
jgi:hypothetical protein